MGQELTGDFPKTGAGALVAVWSVCSPDIKFIFAEIKPLNSKTIHTKGSRTDVEFVECVLLRDF